MYILFLNESELFFYTVTWFHLFLSNANDSIYYCLHTVKYFQVLLCISKNSTKHQSRAYIPLNDQTVLFQTIQFSMSSQFQCQTRQFDPFWPLQVLPISIRVDLGATAMKGYSAFLKALALLEPQIVSCYILDILSGSLSPLHAEKQQMYSTASSNGPPIDKMKFFLRFGNRMHSFFKRINSDGSFHVSMSFFIDYLVWNLFFTSWIFFSTQTRGKTMFSLFIKNFAEKLLLPTHHKIFCKSHMGWTSHPAKIWWQAHSTLLDLRPFWIASKQIFLLD